MKKYILAGLLLSTTNLSFSEDIELYISDSIKQAKARPQVLIVFDTSGSMGWDTTVKAAFNPDIEYDPVLGYTKLGGRNRDTYYTKGQIDIANIPVADDPDEKRKYIRKINSCEVSRDTLATIGYYSGHIREYKFQGNSGRWTELNETDGSGIYITDCEGDTLAGENNNRNYLSGTSTVSLPDGFPIDGEGESAAPQFYTANAADSNVEWSGSLVTLYSANYLRWYHGDVSNAKIGTETRPRIEVAQESVTNLINSSPNVDFGLQVFNRNNSGSTRHGGRIVSAIAEATSASHTALVNVVNNELIASGNTPLCESLYEAARYLGGKTVWFGDDEPDFTPTRDQTAEDPVGTYKSPFSSCSDKAYVILMTDGVPTSDRDADSLVKALGTADNYPMSEYSNNYLAAMAGWMNNNDVNTSVDGKQTVSTYTIGFSSGATAAAPLLTQTALLGGGKYYAATDTATLTAALTNVLADIDPSNDSLTSASVAANNFDRTETLNSVYYAMFQPDRGPRWQGNLKKYKVVGGKQIGRSNKAAIDESTGHFSPDATSFWSAQKDGDQVAEGGIADMLRKKSNRVIYSDIGNNDALVLLNSSNRDTHFGSAQDYADAIGVDVNDIDDYFNWNLGIDVDDEDEDGSKTDMRKDVFGDPLHSKPLVLNYGNKIHLVIGTNAGALHMFKDSGDTVDETWAFMPKEFFPNIKSLRDNFSSSDKVYGVDGKITSHINDKDGDGVIESGDTVWIFFGLRRGGSSYYAMDLSNPDDPKLMWHIDNNTADFSELGQSWSQPKVGFSKLNITSGVAKPVLFFGGGYDISKDNAGVGGDDNVGRAVYMVDAETGALKWSMAPNGGDTTFAGTDSIPSSIATLDSDGDGLVDRLYTGDTGGNVWRVDMPDDIKADFSVFKLASLGGDADNGVDRRFFSEPSIVRTFITETIDTGDKDKDDKTIYVHQELPYDAVLLGSGDRSNPLGTDTDDVFFMIKDKNIITQTFSGSSTPPTPSAITNTDLYDYTDDPFGTVSETERQALSVAVSEKSGWYFDLELDGEKTTSTAIVINNTVYFTTFTPPNLVQNQISCELPNGQGWLYGVDLALGIQKFNWKTDGDNDSKDREDRITFISEQFLGSPTLIVIPDDPSDPKSDSTGNLIVGRKIVSVGFSMQTMRTYLYVTEDQ
jgi:type IV pilus assembly protein PilY1